MQRLRLVYESDLLPIRIVVHMFAFVSIRAGDQDGNTAGQYGGKRAAAVPASFSRRCLVAGWHSTERHAPRLPDGHMGGADAQEEDFETPMQPITVMRNALGGEHGGSGVLLDRAAYIASVEYWKDWAVILWGAQPAGE